MEITATRPLPFTPRPSIIFPPEPVAGHIHHLPESAEFISYDVQDTLILSAWIPADVYTLNQPRRVSTDAFAARYCEGCPRYTYEYLDEYRDEDGELDESQVPDVHCWAYDRGYHGQHCPEGHSMSGMDDRHNFGIQNMVFTIGLNHRGADTARFSKCSDSAALQGGMVTPVTNYIKGTHKYAAANVHGGMGSVCWGSNDRPKDLSEIVGIYMSSVFNNDLTSIETFEQNGRTIRTEIASDYYSRSNVSRGETFLTRGASALLMVDAEQQVPMFFHMLMAGFSPIEQARHIMMIPLFKAEFERGGHTYRGYITDKDAVGKNWFFTYTGQLIGQL